MHFPGTKRYVVTARSPQMVRDQKTFGKNCTRLDKLLLATNSESSWNKPTIRYKRMCLPRDYLDLT